MGMGYFREEAQVFRTAICSARVRHFKATQHTTVENLGAQLGKSTFSEPQAVLNTLCHLLSTNGPTRVRVFTDNTVAQASYTRGFNSHSWHVNDCLRRVHALFGDRFDIDFVYVPGESNPADAYSRGIDVTEAQRGCFAASLRRFAGLVG